MHHEVRFNLTKSQMIKVKHAHDTGTSVNLKLSNKRIVHEGGVPLLLTNNELTKLGDGKVHSITFSATRLRKIGGILPLIPIIAAAIGAASAVAGGTAGVVHGIKGSRSADATRALAEYELKRRMEEDERKKKQQAYDDAIRKIAGKKGGFIKPLITGLSHLGHVSKTIEKINNDIAKAKSGGFIPFEAVPHFGHAYNEVGKNYNEVTGSIDFLNKLFSKLKNTN